MALVKKEDDKEEEKLQIADEDSVPNEGTPGEETQLGGDDEGGKDLKENEDAGGEDEVDGEDNCRTIPILVAILKEAHIIADDCDANDDNGNDVDVNIDDTEDEPEKEINIVKIPKPPTPSKEPLKKDHPPASHTGKPSCRYDYPAIPPCSEYKGARCPGPLSGYHGIGNTGFFPLGMPSFGFPFVIMPAFPCMNMYMPGMSQICGGPGPAFHQGMNPYSGTCSQPEMNYHNQSHHYPFDRDHGSHHHHHGNHHHDDNYHNDHHHHHHGEHHQFDRRSCLSEEERECEELDNCCLSVRDDEHCNEENDDDTKSVEDLLEEYLEDIDEKTELIHEILDECEAMDLVVNIHGFELEEIHVTVSGKNITIKGDHQYSEATWVRVRNFSECYEIPEEFDINKTTATKMGDTLNIRIPHVDDYDDDDEDDDE